MRRAQKMIARRDFAKSYVTKIKKRRNDQGFGKSHQGLRVFGLR
jgi:hypothetical protein